MAHLPISNNSLNMFFNPFNRLECLGFVGQRNLALSFEFNCGNSILQTIRCFPGDQNKSRFHLEISCTPNDDNAVEFCTKPFIQLQTGLDNSSIDFNYVVDPDEVCLRILQDVKLLKFVANQFFILYGCTDNDEEHEEGSWVFGSKQNFNESMEHLSEAFGYLKNSTAEVSDFIVYNISNTANLTGVDVKL